MTTKPHQAVTWEDGRPICVARITGYANALITQATINSAEYRVDAITDEQTQAASEIQDWESITVNDVIFDALQDDFDEPDATGYNFRHQLANGDLPDGGVKYRVHYRLVTEDELPIVLAYEFKTKEIGGD